MIGFKICYELGLERHRENFILRDGANSFLERYPYIQKLHESKLYLEINKEWGIPNEIVPNQIWLGNARHAKNKQIIKGMGITHILNMTTEIDNIFENQGVKYLKIPVHDYTHSEISKYFKLCYDFLVDNSFGRFLIHCVLGRSRSCTIMIMYLMKKYEITYEEASTLLSEKRNIAQVNLGFETQLLKFESNNFKFDKNQVTMQDLHEQDTSINNGEK